MERINLNNLNSKIDIKTRSIEEIENNNLNIFLSSTNTPKLTIFHLTRDLRTSDNLTLYSAYEESLKSNTPLIVIFRFTNQISEKENPYYSKTAVRFMIEALIELSKEINISFIENIPDEEWKKFLKTLNINKIYITRDFTPYARTRFHFYSSIAETIEIDDITVFPIECYKTFQKLSEFVAHVKTLGDNKNSSQIDKTRIIAWKEQTSYLDYIQHQYQPKCSFIKFIKSSQYTITDIETIQNFLKNLNINVNINIKLRFPPETLHKILESLNTSLKGYSDKKIRDLIGKPRVSFISPYLKFGLISIRVLHSYVSNLEGPTKNDKAFYNRELYFRDFYYRAAYDKHEEVFIMPTWQETHPRFVCEEDFLLWKAHKNLELKITDNEEKDIKEANIIYEQWKNAQTEYPLINAGIIELVNTGYMLNKTRILASSYLSRDHGLWWKYAEKFFANNLTDYDWTINAISHQNISKIGYYPNKNEYDFSIEKQQMIAPDDKVEYYLENKCFENI